MRTDPWDRESYSVFSSFPLPVRHSLSSSAINPNIDIIALHRIAPRPPKTPLPVSAILAARRDKAKAEAARKEIESAGWKLKNDATVEDKEDREDKELDCVVISVWRLNTRDGESKEAMVWAKELSGNKLMGLVWTADGSALSIILDVSLTNDEGSPGPSEGCYKLYHLSVHDGSVLHWQHLLPSYPLKTRWKSTTPHDKDLPLHPTWLLNPRPYPQAHPSSSLSIISSIAMPNPVRPWSAAEQLKALGAQNFQISEVASGSMSGGISSIDARVGKLVRSVCGDLPVVLGDGTGDTALEDVGASIVGRMDPHVLHIPELGISLLGGTSPITTPNMLHPAFTTASIPLVSSSHSSTESPPSTSTPKRTTTQSIAGFDRVLLPASTPQDRTMQVMVYGDRARRYLKVIVKGLESCSRTWKEGIDGEHKSWMEKLETCAKDNGTDLLGVRADLTRLLLAGKSGDAISQFIGGPMTNNGLDRWSTLYDASMVEIRSVLTTTIFSSCERLLAIQEELHGWLMHGNEMTSGDGMAVAAMRESMRWTTQLATKVMELDRVAEEECRRFREFVKFLRYEIARSTISQGDEDAEVPSSHDVLLVCDYLDTAFIESQIPSYLWTLEQIEVIEFQRPVLPASPLQRRTKSVLHDALVKLRMAIKQPLASRQGTDPPPAINAAPPAMLSPMLRRGRRESEAHDSAEWIWTDIEENQAPSPTGISLRRQSDDTTSVRSADEDNENFNEASKTSARTHIDWSNPLWPIAMELASGLTSGVDRLLQLGGPLDWKANTVTCAASPTLDLFSAPLCSLQFGGERAECFSEPNERYVAGIWDKNPASLCLTRLVRKDSEADREEACHIKPSTSPSLDLLGTCFYDRTELLILLKAASPGRIYLASIDYRSDTALKFHEQPVGADPHLALDRARSSSVSVPHIRRSRALDERSAKDGKPGSPAAIAANGRAGRRIACLLSGGGLHLDVYDIDVDDISECGLDDSMGMEMD